MSTQIRCPICGKRWESAQPPPSRAKSICKECLEPALEAFGQKLHKAMQDEGKEDGWFEVDGNEIQVRKDRSILVSKFRGQIFDPEFDLEVADDDEDFDDDDDFFDEIEEFERYTRKSEDDDSEDKGDLGHPSVEVINEVEGMLFEDE